MKSSYESIIALALAVAVIGDEENASKWLEQRNRCLSWYAPIDLLDNPKGCEMVVDLLHKIETGGVV